MGSDMSENLYNYIAAQLKRDLLVAVPNNRERLSKYIDELILLRYRGDFK